MKKHSINLGNDDDLVAHFEKTNPEKEAMTVERLRTYPGCENYSEPEAAEIIQALEKLALIILEYEACKNIQLIDNQYDVSLNSAFEASEIQITNQLNKAA
ncbi:MAG: hypothetical protein ACK4E0_03370 [Chitinophagaceae bacterium]